LSYIGGGAFGIVMHVFMLAFRGMDPAFMANLHEADKYKNIRDMFNSIWGGAKGIFHRNGMFVLRLSVFIATFNFIMINVKKNFLNRCHLSTIDLPLYTDMVILTQCLIYLFLLLFC
jgi:hypothetical protein